MANTYYWMINAGIGASNLGITIYVNNVRVVSTISSTSGTFNAETGDTIKCYCGEIHPQTTTLEKWEYVPSFGSTSTSYDNPLIFTAPATGGLSFTVVTLYYTANTKTILATCTQDEGTLAMIIPGQIITPGISVQGTILARDTVSLTATPATGYHFVQWESYNGSTWTPFSISNPLEWEVPDIPQDLTYRAKFSNGVANYLKINATSAEESYIYLQNTVPEGSSFSAPKCQYCYQNTTEWYDVPTSPYDEPITIKIDTEHTEKACVLLRGYNPMGFTQSSTYPSSFKISGAPVTISGNVMSLVDEYGEIEWIPGQEGCFAGLFMGCTNITVIEEVGETLLPATTLNTNCYAWMFRGCTSLKTPPSLTATNLSGSCYAMMFKDCKALVVPPSLRATTLASECYYHMFEGCSLMISAPTLSVTTVDESTAPRAYVGIFKNCVSLREVHCSLASAPTKEFTKNWLYNVEGIGIFYCPSSATWTTGVSGIPENWAKHNE